MTHAIGYESSDLGAGYNIVGYFFMFDFFFLTIW
jgi:hypothetical protein